MDPQEHYTSILQEIAFGDAVELDLSSLTAQVVDSISSSRIGGFFDTVQSIALFFIAIFAILTGIVLYKIVQLNRSSQEADAGKKTMALRARWEEIKRHADSYEEAHWKLALIEMDKLFDDALRNLGYPGETMGDRLKFVHKDQVANLDELWNAHRLRNRLVHEVGYSLTRNEFERAMEQYEKALRLLRAI